MCLQQHNIVCCTLAVNANKTRSAEGEGGAVRGAVKKDDIFFSSDRDARRSCHFSFFFLLFRLPFFICIMYT